MNNMATLLIGTSQNQAKTWKLFESIKLEDITMFIHLNQEIVNPIYRTDY
jgi:hypothetical protein